MPNLSEMTTVSGIALERMAWARQFAESLPDWKGPEHLEEQRRRVVAFLGMHTPR